MAVVIPPLTATQRAGWRATTKHLSPRERAMVMTMAGINEEEGRPMTTTVTVKTKDWPVAVEQSSNHSHEDEQNRSWGSSHTITFVPAHSERTFNVTDTTIVMVRELAKDATGLDHGLRSAMNQPMDF